MPGVRYLSFEFGEETALRDIDVASGTRKPRVKKAGKDSQVTEAILDLGVQAVAATATANLPPPKSFRTPLAPGVKYRRILLKLSGEALMGDKGYGIDPQILAQIADHGAVPTAMQDTFSA